jgi:translation initiation factor 2 alpha subunit (eIF-2alpha)
MLMTVPAAQELAQRDMSVVKKNQLRERFTKMQNAFAAEVKAQQAAKAKQVSADIAQYFEENPNENVYVGEIDVEGDRNVSSVPAKGLVGYRLIFRVFYLYRS